MTMHTNLNQATLPAFDAAHCSWKHPKELYQMIMILLISTSYSNKGIQIIREN